RDCRVIVNCVAANELDFSANRMVQANHTIVAVGGPSGGIQGQSRASRQTVNKREQRSARSRVERQKRQHAGLEIGHGLQLSSRSREQSPPGILMIGNHRTGEEFQALAPALIVGKEEGLIPANRSPQRGSEAVGAVRKSAKIKE